MPSVKPICPNCWAEFELHETLWISTHPSLRGDILAGELAEQP